MAHLFVLKKMQLIDRPYFACPRKVLVKSPDKLGRNVCVRRFINYMEGYYGMDALMSGDACNQSRVYSGTTKSVKPTSSQYRAFIQYVDLPARWSYAITMESEQAKYKQIKAKYEQIKAEYTQIIAEYEQIKAEYEQIKAKYEQIKAKYEQIKAKYEQVNAKFDQFSRSANQTCECNTSAVTDHHTKEKTKFNDQEPLVKVPTDNSLEYRVSLSHEFIKSRMSRTTVDVCTSSWRLHCRRKREREPSRIPYRRIIKLLKKTCFSKCSEVIP